MIVLAGGRAARLGGADKPGLTVGDRTMLDSVVAAGTEAGAQPIVVVGPDRPGMTGAPRFAREEPPGTGPLPALRCGLGELGGEVTWVAVLAADLPFLRAAHLGALLSAAAGADGAVLVDDTGREQWLAGCWRADALRRAAGGYTGASLHALLAPLRPARVTLEPGPGEPPPWLDCDTEADLRGARDWHSRARRQGASPGTTTLRSGSPATNRRTC